MDLSALWTQLRTLEDDALLVEESNLESRAKALDFIRFVDEVIRVRGRTEDLSELKRHADALKGRLSAVDDRLFGDLRRKIVSGSLSADGLRRALDRFTTYTATQVGQPHIGYDALDVLVHGVLGYSAHPDVATPNHPEMVHYEPTPARVVFDLIDHAGLASQDVLYDLGSGLGQVVILISLLAGLKAKGVEYQPTLCMQAQRTAQSLGLANVEFINADARDVDYSDGTMFYLFTPFKGQVLQTVLDRLQNVAHRHSITVCSYGPCTWRIHDQPWLAIADPETNHAYKLAVFHSR